jgi:hypothetical protein
MKKIKILNLDKKNNFIAFTVYYPETGENVAYQTNKSGEGLFRHKNGIYEQYRGTGYTLRNKTRKQIYNKLYYDFVLHSLGSHY